MDSIVQTAKRLALQATNPSEYALRKAGLVDECGNLTSAGVALLHAQLLQDADIRAELVTVAEAINADKSKE